MKMIKQNSLFNNLRRKFIALLSLFALIFLLTSQVSAANAESAANAVNGTNGTNAASNTSPAANSAPSAATKVEASKIQASKIEATSDVVGSNGDNENAVNDKTLEQDALAELKALLAPIGNMQGNFHQKVSSEKGKVLHKSEGKMWLKKPGQFRWEVQGRDHRLVVCDGKQVWDYDPELAQVTIQKFSKNRSGAPIFFLTGNVNTLDKDFIVEVVNKNENGKCLKDSDSCFELKPRKSSNNFHWIRVGFQDKTLKEIELYDQLGQRSLFTFSNLVTNRAISSKQFNFTPPKGVEVVKQ